MPQGQVHLPRYKRTKLHKLEDKKVQGGGDKDQAGELGDAPDQQLLEVQEVTRVDNFLRASSGDSASETRHEKSLNLSINQILWI